MNRSRKLLIAGTILTLGFAFSWPFRHTQDTLKPAAEIPEDTLRAVNGDPITHDPTIQSAPQVSIPLAPEHVSARMASTIESTQLDSSDQIHESFDLANHPAMKGAAESANNEEPSPVDNTPTKNSKPAYSIAEQGKATTSHEDWPQEVLHVVRNGDTLEGLAERYLGDPGRGLEIFDLNRDQLSNPYLLPIGVELRIPSQASRSFD